MKLIHQLASGMAGWLTFEQMRRGVDNLSESTLYKPLEDIAKGRNFQVRMQFPVPKRSTTAGAPRTIDFVMVDHSGKRIIALEVKYKKPERKMAGSLSRDAIKLRDFSLIDAEKIIAAGSALPIAGSVADYILSKALVFVWQSADGLKHVVENEDDPIKKQFRKLIRNMLPDGVGVSAENLRSAFSKGAASKPVANRFGSLRSGSTVTDRRFWVACLPECDLWDSFAT